MMDLSFMYTLTKYPGETHTGEFLILSPVEKNEIIDRPCW